MNTEQKFISQVHICWILVFSGEKIISLNTIFPSLDFEWRCHGTSRETRQQQISSVADKSPVKPGQWKHKKQQRNHLFSCIDFQFYSCKYPSDREVKNTPIPLIYKIILKSFYTFKIFLPLICAFCIQDQEYGCILHEYDQRTSCSL